MEKLVSCCKKKDKLKNDDGDSSPSKGGMLHKHSMRSFSMSRSKNDMSVNSSAAVNDEEDESLWPNKECRCISEANSLVKP